MIYSSLKAEKFSRRPFKPPCSPQPQDTLTVLVLTEAVERSGRTCYFQGRTQTAFDFNPRLGSRPYIGCQINLQQEHVLFFLKKKQKTLGSTYSRRERKKSQWKGKPLERQSAYKSLIGGQGTPSHSQTPRPRILESFSILSSSLRHP